MSEGARPTDRDAVRACYQDREASFRTLRDALSGRSGAIANARLVAAIAALAGLDREWSALEPVPPYAPSQTREAMAADLDLMTHDGHGATLLRLLGTAHTPWGRQELVAWLLAPAAPEMIAARQQAVDELAPALDWRQQFEASARTAARSASDPGPFLEWVESAPWLQARPLLRLWLARALAGLHHDHPAGCFPEIRADAARLQARELGHPLLNPEDCVPNDVTIGPAGTCLLVTGSNMSGKSTLLRAIGLNTVLALAGGPVFARAMSLPPVALCTSFRVQDSLESGISFFMAELQRLKQIVDLARQRSADAGPTLFLLDEILQGTNVTERQIAVRRVLGFLLERGAIGAISTHDLGLAEAEGLREACQPVHFTESYEEGPHGPQMRFDYALREGVAPTVNALKLLEIVGLGES